MTFSDNIIEAIGTQTAVWLMGVQFLIIVFLAVILRWMIAPLVDKKEWK